MCKKWKKAIGLKFYYYLYVNLFFYKVFQYLYKETQTASGGKLEIQEKISGPKSGKETLKSINRKENFRQKKLKRLRENAKQIRFEIIQYLAAKTKQNFY